MLGRGGQRGDTLIEVILAFAVFAMLAIGTMTLMNHGSSTAQQALETTLTQKEIDGQVEALKYMRESYASNPNAAGAAAEFKKIIDNYVIDGNPSAFGDGACVSGLPNATKIFAVNPENSTLISYSNVHHIDYTGATAYPQIVTTGGTTKAYGIWVEAVRGRSLSASTQPGYVDFHVRACWRGPAGSVPVTTGTIVRLYVPGIVADAGAGGATPPAGVTQVTYNEPTLLWPTPVCSYSYTLKWRPAGSTGAWSTVTTTTPQHTFSPALAPGIYEYDIQSHTNSGTGGYCPKYVGTFSTPGASSVTCNATTFQCTFQWARYSDGAGGLRSEYTIRYKRASDPTWTTFTYTGTNAPTPQMYTHTRAAPPAGNYSYEIVARSGATEIPESKLTGTFTSPQPANLTIVVKKIPQLYPNGGTVNPTPPCTNTASANKNGASVTVGSTTQSTNTLSSATFSGLAPITSYSLQSTPPSGYQICPGGVTTVSTTTATGNEGSTTTVTTYTIRPICSLQSTYIGSSYKKGAYRGQFDYGYPNGQASQNSPNTIWSDPYISGTDPAWFEYTGYSPWAGAYRYYVWTAVWSADYANRWQCSA